MQITTGVTSLQETEDFLKQGAHEIYCGFAPLTSHRPSALNFPTAQTLYEAVTITHALNKRIFVALNELYPKKRYNDVCKLLSLLETSPTKSAFIKNALPVLDNSQKR